MKKPVKEIGIVFSGGGFRGIAHIGVIKYLEELNLSPSFVSGTSAGGLVGSFYAAGYSADEILNYFLNADIFRWKNYAFRMAGLLDPTKFISTLKEYFPENSFEDLSKKLFLSVTNLESGKGEIVDTGDLTQYIIASAALPLLFAPVDINGTFYADGGIVNNFPVEPILPYCKKIIGIYVNPLEMKKKHEFKHTYSVVERALNITSAAHSVPKFSLCDVMLIPEKLKYFSFLGTSHLQDIFEIGYETAELHRDQLITLRDS